MTDGDSEQIRALWMRYSHRSQSSHQDPLISLSYGSSSELTRSSTFDKDIDPKCIADQKKCSTCDIKTFSILNSNDVKSATPTEAATVDAEVCPTCEAKQDAAAENVRLRAMNHELAEQLEIAKQDNDRKQRSMEETEEGMIGLWETAKSHQTKWEELQAENQRLSALVERLRTSVWRPVRKLKERLSNADASLKVAHSQIAAMKEILSDLNKERNELRDQQQA